MNRDKSILGIHIDDNFLNIVHLERTADGLQVHGWTVEPLEEGTVKEGLIVQDETIAQKIRDFLQANKLKAHKAIMSPSCATVRLKPSQVAARTDEQLQKQVEDQIRKYVLFGNEETVFDYCTFEEVARDPSKRTVLEAVTTRRISDACLRVAKQAHLNLIGIEPAILPIIKLVPILSGLLADSAGVSLLLALDSVSCNISVFKDGLPQFCQNFSVGVKDVSQNEDSFICLTDQMKPILEFSRSLTVPASAGIVLRVVASCHSEQLHGIVGKMERSLSGVAVEQIEPARIAEHLSIESANGGDLPIFAFALALMAPGIWEFAEQLTPPIKNFAAGINLVSQESLARQRTQKEMSLTAKAIVVVVLLSVAAIYPLKMKARAIETASAGIEVKVMETVPMKQKMAALTEQIKQLDEKLSAYALAGQMLTDVPWPQALRVIGNSVPNGVRIVDISTTDSADFTLVGEALAESDVHRFARKLQNAELIDTAEVEEIEYDSSDTATMVDYKIACKIRLPEGNL